MILSTGQSKILVANQPVDFRCGHKGLTAIVQSTLSRNPKSDTIFIFRSKVGDKVKMLKWDGTGLVLVYKKLEKGEFVWPQAENGTITISSEQLESLFKGLDWQKIQPEQNNILPGIGRTWSPTHPTIKDLN